MDAARIERTLRRMSYQLLENASRNASTPHLELIGLNERGYYLAGQMQHYLNSMISAEDSGVITAVRLHQLWVKPEAAQVSAPPGFSPDAPFVPSLPEKLYTLAQHAADRHHFVLIDDVLFSGQSLAKAFSLLFSAASGLGDVSCPRISTAILLDRGHRRFPLYPELLGMRYPTKFNEHIEAQLPPAHSIAAVVLQPEFDHSKS